MFLVVSAVTIVLVYTLAMVDAYFTLSNIWRAAEIAIYATLGQLLANGVALGMSKPTGRGRFLQNCAYLVFLFVVGVYALYAWSSVTSPNKNATNHLVFLPIVLFVVATLLVGVAAAVAYIWQVEPGSKQGRELA